MCGTMPKLAMGLLMPDATPFEFGSSGGLGRSIINYGRAAFEGYSGRVVTTRRRGNNYMGGG